MGSVGFLPENPYVYPYLTPREFVSLCGRLNGLSGAALTKKTEEAIDRVEIAYAMDRPVRNLSKGMLQRTGLAAALVHDPEVLILDEPMSGLDPVGRKEVRDLIVDERKKGKTIFFSSHILSDVELLCDSIVILKKGEVVVSAARSKRSSTARRRRAAEIMLRDAPDALADALEQTLASASPRGGARCSTSKSRATKRSRRCCARRSTRTSGSNPSRRNAKRSKTSSSAKRSEVRARRSVFVFSFVDLGSIPLKAHPPAVAETCKSIPPQPTSPHATRRSFPGASSRGSSRASSRGKFEGKFEGQV